MAYKRTTRKFGSGRVSTTQSTTGPSTYSISTKAGGTTRTTTQKGNKSYVTETIRDGNGWVSKKRIYSSHPRKKKEKEPTKLEAMSDFLFIAGFGILGLIVFIANIFR